MDCFSFYSNKINLQAIMVLLSALLLPKLFSGILCFKIMCCLLYLEVRAGDTGCDLFEERLLDPDELRWLDHVQDLLNLPQEHHLNTHIFIANT